MPLFIFTGEGEKAFYALPQEIQARIRKKLEEIKTHPKIFSVLRKIEHHSLATHRLRIGEYRVLLRLKEEKGEEITFLVIKMNHRKDVYR